MTSSDDTPVTPAPMPAHGRWSIWAIVLIALLHGLACHFIARTTSATFDEPMHAFSGAMIVQHGDFRPGFDHPPLVHFLAGLAQPRPAGLVRGDAPYTDLLARSPIVIWNATVDELYHRPGFDGAAFVDRARVPMPIVAGVGVLLVGLTARAVAGPLAGVLAALLMGVDPNFLAHGGLVKNDVAIAACYVAVAWHAWRMLARITWPRVATLGLLFGIALLTKFSAILLIACVLLVLLARAWKEPRWQADGDRVLQSRRTRLIRWLAATATVCVIAYCIVWAGYGFSYYASPHGNIDPIHTADLVDLYHQRTNRTDLPASIRTLLWANHHHLLPEAFLNGLIYQDVTVLRRPSFIMGEHHVGGDWYYFPVAALVKLPLGTLALTAIAACALVRRRTQQRREFEDPDERAALQDWAIALFGVIVAAYALASLATPLNIGIRHLFPIFPFVFIGAGWAAARWIEKRQTYRVAAIVLLGLVAAESALATPNQLAFVNLGARAIEPARWWLGDSNLDWGQGLRALAEWQKDGHADHPLYLAYFGTADPETYGVRYLNLPNGSPFGPLPGVNLGGYLFGPPADAPDFAGHPGYFAISMSQLQNGGADERGPFAGFKAETPLATLGGSILVFDTNAPASQRLVHFLNVVTQQAK